MGTGNAGKVTGFCGGGIASPTQQETKSLANSFRDGDGRRDHLHLLYLTLYPNFLWCNTSLLLKNSVAECDYDIALSYNWRIGVMEGEVSQKRSSFYLESWAHY